MNLHAVRAIYQFEMARTWRTLFQSIATPVMTTSLYFVVFGSAIGSRMMSIDGVSYGAFIVPGLIMLTVLMESVSNGSFGIYMPKFAGTIYELLSAPVGLTETLLGYTGAAATKSVILGLVILATARLFVPFSVEHPFWMIAFLVLTSVTFALLGFLIGIWADSWEKIQIVPMMVVTPLTFLGGSFYSISMLPPIWQKITLFNPVVYLVNGFRWSFYGISDVNVVLSFGMTTGLHAAVPARSSTGCSAPATSSRTSAREPETYFPQHLPRSGCPRLGFSADDDTSRIGVVEREGAAIRRHCAWPSQWRRPKSKGDAVCVGAVIW